MQDFFEFLNRKDTSKLNNSNFTSEPIKEPNNFSIQKTNSSKRIIKPFIGGLAGQSFRNRTIPNSPTKFLARSGSTFKKF